MPPSLHPNDQRHDELELLLPWYATDQLDLLERTMVAQHLESCLECNRALRAEHTIIAGYRTLEAGTDGSWARMHARLRSSEYIGAKVARSIDEFWRSISRPAVGVFATVQVALIVCTVGITTWLRVPEYHVLGSPSTSHSANVIVIFRSGASASDMTSALHATGASVVGGPTPTDAYLLFVPGQRRQAALAILMSNKNVELAQPLDETSS